MWMVPDEWYTRLHNTYTDVFLLTLIWNIGLFSMIFFTLFSLMLIIKKIINRKQQKQLTRSLLTQNSLDQFPIPQKISIKRKILNILIDILFYLFLISISMMYLSAFIFGKAGNSTFLVIIAPVISLLIVLIPTIIFKYLIKQKNKNNMRQYIIIGIMMILWLGISIGVVIVLRQICVCSNIDVHFFKLDRDYVATTKYSRDRSIRKICPNGELCHLFATLSEDSSTSVFINIHTGVDLTHLSVQITQISKQKNLKRLNEYKIITDGQFLTGVQELAQRNIHTAFFKDLKPKTVYQLIIINSINNVTLKKTTYRTFPENESNLKMVVGGDLSLEQNGTLLTSYITKINPDVILFGGDNTYDDAMRTCYFNWDTFYWRFQNLQLTMNRVIPLILSVGNHDVGYDALASVALNQQQDSIPLFFVFNPQHTLNSSSIPKYNQRSSYHYHKMGNILLLNLDSGYITPYEVQAQFIQSLSNKYNNTYKFANYHNPIYPYCGDRKDNSNDMNIMNLGKKFWVPLFDKYNFIASMEHHTHHRKITHRLKNNSIHENGTRYLGDGSWGPLQQICPQHFRSNQPELFHDFDTHSPNHIWEITLFSNGNQNYINYTAINKNGNAIFDPIIQKLL